MMIHCHNITAGIPEMEQAIKECYKPKLQFPAMSILKNPEGSQHSSCKSSEQRGCEAEPECQTDITYCQAGRRVLFWLGRLQGTRGVEGP